MGDQPGDSRLGEHATWSCTALLGQTQQDSHIGLHYYIVSLTGQYIGALRVCKMDEGHDIATGSAPDPVSPTHPMVTRRKQGMADIFQDLTAQQIQKLQLGVRRTSGSHTRSDVHGHEKSSQNDDHKWRRRRSSAGANRDDLPRSRKNRPDSVESGRVTKSSSTNRQRKVGVAYSEAPQFAEGMVDNARSKDSDSENEK